MITVKYLAIIAFYFITVIVSAGNVSASLTDGLIAYYPFNGNANDESIHGNHGLTQGGVHLTTDRFQNENSAYSFDGIDGHIVINDSESLDISGPITITSWILTNNTSIGNAIVNKLGSTLESRNGYYTYVSDYDVANKFHFGLTCDWPQIGQTGSSTTSVDDGIWHHVTGTYDGATIKVFVDGRLEDSKSYSSGILTNDNQLNIGWDPWNSYGHENRHFNGKIDDVRIYNRALSEDEIRALYNLTAKAGQDQNIPAYPVATYNGPIRSGRIACVCEEFWRVAAFRCLNEGRGQG